MIIQVGKYQIVLGALAFVIMTPDEVNTEKVQLHFIGGTLLELATPELVNGYKSALSALRFGVGTPLPKN